MQIKSILNSIELLTLNLGEAKRDEEAITISFFLFQVVGPGMWLQTQEQLEHVRYHHQIMQ